MKMKSHVLFLIESLSGGGAEKVLSTLLQSLDYSRFEVTLCCVVDKGRYQRSLPPSVRYRYILPDCDTLPQWRRWLYGIQYKMVYRWLPLPLVYRWFVPGGADVEVAFVEGFATKLLAKSTNRKARRLAWVHIDLFRNHWTKSVFKTVDEEAVAYNSYSSVVGVSATVREAFKREFPQVTVPVRVLYNPVDAHAIRTFAQEPFPQSLPPQKSLRLVTVGRLEAQKAYGRLLRIVRRLREEDGLSFELWILGEGTERGELERYIADNQLSEVVKLLGFKRNPYQYIAACDLFVCSSIAEGYSTAVTEALILGIPVITTDCSGMDELLRGGQCGVVTDNSEDALYEGLRPLLREPALLETYRQKAVERSRDFELDGLMRPIEKVFCE